MTEHCGYPMERYAVIENDYYYRCEWCGHMEVIPKDKVHEVID